MTNKIENAGTLDWRVFVEVLKAGAALGYAGTRPRGANGLNAYPQTAPDGGAESKLDARWAESVSRADKILYHWMTPVAWTLPGVGWIVPADTYSAQTSAAQNRIRAELGNWGLAWISDAR